MNEKETPSNHQTNDNQTDTMKANPDYDAIDMKFIDAINIVLKKNSDLGIRPSNDSSLGKMIYPSNRSIISSVRSRSKHIPHLALINFAKRFNVDMNYFYGAETLDYIPKPEKHINKSDNSITNNGDQNNIAHAGNGKIKEVKNVNNEPNSNNIRVETMINNFMGKLDKDCVAEFYRIINEIRKENTDLNHQLRQHIKKKSEKIEKMALQHKDELKQIQDILATTNENLFKAQKSESDILKKYIASIDNR